MNHLISEWADEELDEAAAYYEAEKPGLGGEFLSEFEDAHRRCHAPASQAGLLEKTAQENEPLTKVER